MARRLLVLLVLVAAALLAAWLLTGRDHEQAEVTPPVASAPVSPAQDAELVAPVAETRVSAERPAAPIDSADMQGPPVPIGLPEPAGRLHGRVLPASGRTVLAGEVAVEAKDVLGKQQRVFCRAGGAYAFEALASGRYWLRVGSVENGSADTVVDVRGDTVRDIQLEARPVLEIRVVDELRKPVDTIGLYAVATAEAPGEWLEEARVGANNPIALGRFEFAPRLPGPPSEVIGSLYLNRDLPLHVSLMKYQRVLETRLVVRGYEAVEFVFHPDNPLAKNAGIRLRVVDAGTKEPLQKASISAGGVGERMQPVRDGVCEFQDLQAGTYRLQIRSKDYGTARRDVLVPPGETVDLGDVPMSRGYWVSGRVLDETGRAGACDIRFDPCDADGSVAPLYGGIYVSRTEPDGSFRITGLAPGFHRIEVMAKGKSAECVAVFDLRNGPVENVTLTVTAGVPLVVDPNGKEGPEARFAVLDEKGVRVVSRLVAQPDPVRVLLAPGRYTVESRSSREDPDPRTAAFEIVRDPLVMRMR